MELVSWESELSLIVTWLGAPVVREESVSPGEMFLFHVRAGRGLLDRVVGGHRDY